MRSGKLPAYSSLNRFLNSILSSSWSYFVQIQPIFVNLTRVWRAERPTDEPSFRDAKAHLIKWRQDYVLDTRKLEVLIREKSRPDGRHPEWRVDNEGKVVVLVSTAAAAAAAAAAASRYGSVHSHNVLLGSNHSWQYKSVTSKYSGGEDSSEATYSLSLIVLLSLLFDDVLPS